MPDVISLLYVSVNDCLVSQHISDCSYVLLLCQYHVFRLPTETANERIGDYAVVLQNPSTRI